MNGRASLRAGVARRNITPPIGVDLTGYGGRPSGCTSVHDDLYVRALVLDDGSRTLALVSMDVLGIDFDVRDEIRARVQDALDIPPAALLLNASHTHAGPATESLRGLGERDPTYVSTFIESVVRAVEAAFQNTRPARIGRTRVPVRIGVNRRQRLASGRTVIGDNPDGLILPYSDVLRVDTTDGERLAVWFAHACHPVTLGGENLAVSADFPGVAAELVESVTGGTALFAQGCGGDINPLRRGDFDRVRSNGRILGGAVLSGAESVEPRDDRPALDACIETVDLALQGPPPLDEVDAMIAQCRATVKEAQDKGLHRGHVRLRQAALDWAIAMRAYSKEPDAAPKTLPFEIQALRIGDLAIVGLPAEMFAEVGHAIEAASPFEQTSVLGYTNGCHGYFPSASAYPNGGYEVRDAIRYYGTLMFSPKSDAQLRAGVGKLLNELVRATVAT